MKTLVIFFYPTDDSKYITKLVEKLQELWLKANGEKREIAVPDHACLITGTPETGFIKFRNWKPKFGKVTNLKLEKWKQEILKEPLQDRVQIFQFILDQFTILTGESVLNRQLEKFLASKEFQLERDILFHCVDDKVKMDQVHQFNEDVYIVCPLYYNEFDVEEYKKTAKFTFEPSYSYNEILRKIQSH